MVEEFEMLDGTTLYRWSDSGGQAWACCAFDHGPLCRLCNPVDEFLDGLLQNALDGNAIVRHNAESGNMEFQLTDQGNMAAKALIRSLAEDEND